MFPNLILFVLISTSLSYKSIINVHKSNRSFVDFPKNNMYKEKQDNKD